MLCGQMRPQDEDGLVYSDQIIHIALRAGLCPMTVPGCLERMDTPDYGRDHTVVFSSMIVFCAEDASGGSR